MKSLVFVTGVAVGAVATVGAAVGTALIALDKITDGGVKEVFVYALQDIKNVLDGKEIRTRTRPYRQYTSPTKEETTTCDSPSDS